MFITLAELGWREAGSGREVRDGRATLLKDWKTASGGRERANKQAGALVNK